MESQNVDNSVQINRNANSILTNILRVLSMLEKALDRKVRQTYHDKSQYPAEYFEVQQSVATLRAWIEGNRIYCGIKTFNMLVGLCLDKLGQLTAYFILESCSVNGKKRCKKTRLIADHNSICKSINDMMNHIKIYVDQLPSTETDVGIEIEKELFDLFAKHCSEEHKKNCNSSISKRGEKTYIFPCSDTVFYLDIVNDSQKFRTEVLDKFVNTNLVTGHSKSCNGEKRYRLRGFRRSPRKTIVEGGKHMIFPIRMIECISSGQKYSLLPSFLPREKHFCINIIGNILRNILLSGQSLRAAQESMKLTGKELKSKQTILNWIRWVGTFHPATILTRAGVRGSGYLQEDEGFEKEPNLRTYSVAMVDPDNLLVWHMDYVDHVDEETLCISFEKFVEKIDFKILGVTKDKWLASTNALKTVFHSIWIGFCHRHCLKKFRHALSEYQKTVKCSDMEVTMLYRKLKKALDTATSKISLDVKLSFIDEPAFSHDLIRPVIDEIRKNGVHYTAHRNRDGIKKTTSLVDNFLKTVKRKLRQAESFRDRDSTGLLFRAMANVRNFVPFMSGAKNAHKSPFMLAQGQTYDLPWIQTMNMHNAFLFADNCY